MSLEGELQVSGKQSVGGAEPAGLGGWLILPLLALVAAPAFELHSQWRTFLDIHTYWEALSVAQKSLIIAEMLIGIVVSIFAPLALLAFAYKRFEIFPGLYIIWIWSKPVITLIDGFLAAQIFGDVIGSAEIFDQSTIKGIGQGVTAATIWTIYMYRSRRVANTFVK